MNRRDHRENTTIRVFDDLERTAQDYGRFSTTAFEFLNSSPWKWVELTRNKIEDWFAKIPADKQRGLRERLRSDDRVHSGALLELVSHELLLKLCQGVVMEPKIAGGYPDFSAVFRGIPTIVECTVAQGTDKEFGALKRERDVLDIIDAVDVGPYKLWVEPRRVGNRQPPKSQLTKYLKDKVALMVSSMTSLGNLGPRQLDRRIVWQWEDWTLHFRLIPMGSEPKGGTVGIMHSGLRGVIDDKIIARALERKSEAYSGISQPYLVIAAQREGTGNEEDLMDALLGPEQWILSEDTNEVWRRRPFTGFFGSADKPRNRHVSAILYKRSLRGAWGITNQWTSHDIETGSNIRPPDWILVHHLAAKNPLQEGMFPFALEIVWRSEVLTPIQPKCTINEVLGLPDPWPVEEK